MVAVAVKPKILRCLSRRPKVTFLPKSKDLACWNWALTGLNEAAPPIDPLYNYVNGFSSINDVDAIKYPSFTSALRSDLIALEKLWAPCRDKNYGGEKIELIKNYSKAMAALVAKIYGLPVSSTSTGIEVCMHFEATLQQGPKESKQIFAERQAALGLGFEHWWIRFKGKIIVETFPGITVLQLAQTEQNHRHLTIWRAHVSGLHKEHITKLTDIIQILKGGATPFVHAANQHWVADSTTNTCTWCLTPFSTFNRRHHCRSCGKIFCADCAFQKELVVNPSVEKGISKASIERVCDTCYTGDQ